MILQEGSSTRRWLLWALEEPVTYFEAVKLNKRLAYRFGGVQKWATRIWLVAAGAGDVLAGRAGRGRCRSGCRG
jgi:hypothetical protein